MSDSPMPPRENSWFRTVAAQVRQRDSADQRPDAEGRQEEAECRGVPVELLTGEDRDQHSEVRREDTDHCHQKERDHEHRCRSYVAHRLGNVGNDIIGPRSPLGNPLELHKQQAPQHGEEAQAVHKKAEGRARGADEQARDRGAHRAGSVKDGRVHGYRIHEIFFADHLDDECLACWHVYGVYHAQKRSEDQDVPVLDHAREVEQGQRKGEEHQGGLGKNDYFPLGEIIDEGPRKEREEQHGQKLQGGDYAKLEGRMGHLQHEPRLSHVLHPRSDEGHELPGKEKSEISVPQRAEKGFYH
jgi:hypothetical protein